MSWLAHIAYENDDGTFDVYKSHNGAEDFYLTPYLQEVAKGEADRTLSTVDARKPWDSMGSSPPGDKVDGLDDAVSNQPVARRVTKAQLPRVIDFIHSEGLYIVRDDVEIYLPVWTYPRVLDALAEFFELEVYDRNDTYLERAQEGGELLDAGATPIATLSGTDFFPGSLDEPALRRYIERVHLSLFQTGTEPLDSGGRGPTGGGVVFDEVTMMNEQETEFVVPSGKGRGVFVQLDWSDDRGRPLDLQYVRDYVESSRIDASYRIIQNRQDGEEIEEMEEQVKYIGRLVKRFSNRVADFAASPFDKYIETFADRYGAKAMSTGDLYRVVKANNRSENYSFRPKEDKITPKKDVWTQSNDVEIRSVRPPSDESAMKTQFEYLREGDVIKADLVERGSDEFETTSIELQRRTELVFVESDFVPDFVGDKYTTDIEPELEKSGNESNALMAGSVLKSYSDDIDGSRSFVGEFLVTAGSKADLLWDRIDNGNLAEEMYGGFRNHGIEPPSEAIFVNPDTRPFWYGLMFETPRTGLSRKIHTELGIQFPD